MYSCATTPSTPSGAPSPRAGGRHRPHPPAHRIHQARSLGQRRGASRPLRLPRAPAAPPWRGVHRLRAAKHRPSAPPLLPCEPLPTPAGASAQPVVRCAETWSRAREGADPFLIAAGKTLPHLHSTHPRGTTATP
eukprot:scaffold8888_cov115-Isochrysis_galbana.AAC.2